MPERILVVDDTEAHRYAVARLLRHQGYEVAEASTGEEAIRLARRQRPDLAILDVRLPGLDGLEVCRVLRSDPSTASIGILHLSASLVEVADRVRGLEHGADGYLTSPVQDFELLATVRAVLRTRAAEKAAVEREREFRALFEQSGIGQAELEAPSGRYLRANRKYADIVGRSEEELRGLRPTDLMTPGQDAITATIADYLAGNRGDRLQVEMAFLRPDGRLVVVESTATLLRDETGRPIRSFQTIQDVTARRALEDELSRRLEELQALFEVVPVGLAIARDRECRDIRVNPAAAALLQIPVDGNASVEAPEGPPPFRLCRNGHELSAEELPMQSCAASGQPVRNVEVDVVRSDGSTVTLLETVAPLFDAEHRPRGAVGVFVDFTERKRMELELARSNAELLQFAYAASHDLKEPLRTVGSFAQLVSKRYAGRLDAEADEYLGYVVAGVVRMEALIDGLLAYSRAGRREQELALVPLDRALDQAVANLGRAIQESGAAIVREPLPQGWVDERQFVQLFQNLLSNALTFRKARPEIRVRAEAAGPDWVISVQDQGIGIEERHLERIFRLFQRLHPREAYPGTGVGLTLCRKIVERHGGRIWAESRPGEGSTFRFTVPRLGSDATRGRDSREGKATWSR